MTLDRFMPRNVSSCRVGRDGAAQAAHSRRTSRWATIADKVDETRNGATPMSNNLMMAATAFSVWNVEKTLWPVRGAFEGHLDRRFVTDLTHDDRVGVLSNDRAKRVDKRGPDLLVDVALHDPVDDVLDRILSGDHDLFRIKVVLHERVERRRFSRPGRPGDQDETGRARQDHVRDQRFDPRRETELVERHQPSMTIEETKNKILAMHRHVAGHADVHFAPVGLDEDLAVLVQPPLGDVSAGQHLESRRHAGGHLLRQLGQRSHAPIDTDPNAKPVWRGLDVQIAGADPDGFEQQVVDGAHRLAATRVGAVRRLGHAVLELRDPACGRRPGGGLLDRLERTGNRVSRSVAEIDGKAEDPSELFLYRSLQGSGRRHLEPTVALGKWQHTEPLQIRHRRALEQPCVDVIGGRFEVRRTLRRGEGSEKGLLGYPFSSNQQRVVVRLRILRLRSAIRFDILDGEVPVVFEQLDQAELRTPERLHALELLARDLAELEQYLAEALLGLDALKDPLGPSQLLFGKIAVQDEGIVLVVGRVYRRAVVLKWLWRSIGHILSQMPR